MGSTASEYTITKDLSVLVGFKDAHVGVVYNTGIPLVGRVTLRIESFEITHVEKLLVVEKDWIERAPAVGRDLKPLTEAKISKNVSAFVGYKDAHVEIAVKLRQATGLPWPCPETYAIKVPKDAVPKVEFAIKMANDWLKQPEIERFLKGAE
jgi:hypothetical protein